MGKKYYEIELPSTCPVDAITRWQKAIAEMVAGYDEDPELDVIFDLPHDEIVISRGLGFNSLCEHHLFPFFGTVDIAYLPEEGIVGLSKLARTVEIFSKRLQTQERLTMQIANTLMESLDAKGVAVTIDSTHQCMTMRGIKKEQATTVTNYFLGKFKEDLSYQNRYLRFIAK